MPCVASQIVPQRTMFDAASERVTVDNECESWNCPTVTQSRDERRDGEAIATRMFRASPSQPVLPPWEIDAESALAMNVESLRESLQSAGIAVYSDEARESLLKRFADLMDEVDRRELLIELAVDAENWGIAAELQRGRSDRGDLAMQMRDAKEEGDWERMFALRVEADIRKFQRADPTQDPGSYDPYLDQDPWYRPNR